MTYGDLSIINKLSEIYQIHYGYLQLFPKRDQHALGTKCEMYITAILELLLAAGYAARGQKLQLLEQASTKLDALKFFIRVARQINILDEKKYITLQTDLQDIGKMLGGWLRSLKENS